MNDPPKPLMPYASHATGSGKTPIGIIMFACSHLLLGSVLVAVGVRSVRWLILRSSSGPLAADEIALLLSVPILGVLMVAAGASLFGKGRRAWRVALTAHVLVALAELETIAIGAWAATRYRIVSQANWMVGTTAAGIGTAMIMLCVVVLGYLSHPKSRGTFALPEGQTPPELLWLPRLTIAVWFVLIMCAAVMYFADPLHVTLQFTKHSPGLQSVRDEPSAQPAVVSLATTEPVGVVPSTSAPALIVTPTPPAAPAAQPASVACIAFAGDGRMITASEDGAIILRDLVSGSRQEIRLAHSGLHMMQASPSGQFIALAFADQPVVWDMHTSSETRLGGTTAAQAIAFSADGRTLASTNANGEVHLWDTVSWTQSAVLSPGGGAVPSFAFSPDGRTIALAGAVLAVWEVPSRSVKTKINIACSAAAFSPDGKTIFAAGERAARGFDTVFWQSTLELPHPQRVTQVVPWGGGQLVTGCADGLIRVWDLSTHQTRLVLHGLDAAPQSIAFFSDGRTLAACAAGKVKVWDAATGQDRTPATP